MRVENRHDLLDLLFTVPLWELPPGTWPEVASALDELGAALNGGGDPYEAWQKLRMHAPTRIGQGLGDVPADSQQAAPAEVDEVVTRLIRQLGTFPDPPQGSVNKSDGSNP